MRLPQVKIRCSASWRPISFPAARPDRLTTGFSFSLLPVHTSYIPDFPLLTIQVAQFGEALRHFSGGDELTDQDWADIPWGELFRQISGQTPAGESAVFTFDAAQYSRYLPLTMTGDRQYNVLPQSVTSYFPIPIPQDYTFTIELQKEADGSYTELESPAPGQDESWAWKYREDGQTFYRPILGPVRNVAGEIEDRTGEDELADAAIHFALMSYAEPNATVDEIINEHIDETVKRLEELKTESQNAWAGYDDETSFGEMNAYENSINIIKGENDNEDN